MAQQRQMPPPLPTPWRGVALSEGRGNGSLQGGYPIGAAGIGAPTLGPETPWAPRMPLGASFGSGSSMYATGVQGNAMPTPGVHPSLDGLPSEAGDPAGVMRDPYTGAVYAVSTLSMPDPKILRGDPGLYVPGQPSRQLEEMTGISHLPRPVPQEIALDWEDAVQGITIPADVLQNIARKEMDQRNARDLVFTQGRESEVGWNDAYADGCIGDTFVLRPVIDTQTVLDNDEFNGLAIGMPGPAANPFPDYGNRELQWGGALQPVVSVLAREAVKGAPRSTVTLQDSLPSTIFTPAAWREDSGRGVHVAPGRPGIPEGPGADASGMQPGFIAHGGRHSDAVAAGRWAGAHGGVGDGVAGVTPLSFAAVADGGAHRDADAARSSAGDIMGGQQWVGAPGGGMATAVHGSRHADVVVAAGRHRVDGGHLDGAASHAGAGIATAQHGGRHRDVTALQGAHGIDLPSAAAGGAGAPWTLAASGARYADVVAAPLHAAVQTEWQPPAGTFASASHGGRHADVTAAPARHAYQGVAADVATAAAGSFASASHGGRHADVTTAAAGRHAYQGVAADVAAGAGGSFASAGHGGRHAEQTVAVGRHGYQGVAADVAAAAGGAYTSASHGGRHADVVVSAGRQGYQGVAADVAAASGLYAAASHGGRHASEQAALARHVPVPSSAQDHGGLGALPMAAGVHGGRSADGTVLPEGHHVVQVGGGETPGTPWIAMPSGERRYSDGTVLPGRQAGPDVSAPGGGNMTVAAAGGGGRWADVVPASNRHSVIGMEAGGGGTLTTASHGSRAAGGQDAWTLRGAHIASVPEVEMTTVRMSAGAQGGHGRDAVNLASAPIHNMPVSGLSLSTSVAAGGGGASRDAVALTRQPGQHGDDRTTGQSLGSAVTDSAFRKTDVWVVRPGGASDGGIQETTGARLTFAGTRDGGASRDVLVMPRAAAAAGDAPQGIGHAPAVVVAGAGRADGRVGPVAGRGSAMDDWQPLGAQRLHTYDEGDRGCDSIDPFSALADHTAALREAVLDAHKDNPAGWRESYQTAQRFGLPELSLQTPRMALEAEVREGGMARLQGSLADIKAKAPHPVFCTTDEAVESEVDSETE